MDFDQAFTRLLGHEGSFSDHPSDPGGRTMWGVTERVARAAGYKGDMRAFPQEMARAIYKKSYWNAVRADELPELLRFDVFDAAVNSGPVQAIKWLQTAVHAEPDGVLGPRTFGAAVSADPLAVARFNGLRLRAMKDMKGWPSFSRGWADRIADNLIALGAP